MKALRKIFTKANAGIMLNALAILVVVQNVNSACFWLAYQPEVPVSAKKFMK